MKIIYTGIKAENYNPVRSPSFEYSNFYLQLKAMHGVEVIEYPYDYILKTGKKRFNEELLALVEREKPDLFFAFMYTDEFDAKMLDAIKQKTKSVAWFADDQWRIHNYSRFYAPHFTYAVTTWSKAPEIYARYGIKNTIRSQWACNPNKWKPVAAEKDIDVSFVGQRTDKRAKIVEELRRSGINVYTRGWGWPEGRANEDEMIKIFSSSKINLNISDSPNIFGWKYLSRLFLRRSMNRIAPSFRFADNFRSWKAMSIPQIKARPFELSACDAFVISGYADDLEKFYKENEEMVFYRTPEELAEKIKFYLPKNEERMKIAKAGYERTLREHTYEKRFREIFEIIGLPF